ncbi:MAG: hypothetical protein ABI675_24325 [Chitinophagaceae bacterium]
MRKTEYKSSAPIYEKRWSLNKSGRGIEVKDIAENLGNGIADTEIVWELSYPEKLEFLLSKNPFNSFYRSLDDSIKFNIVLSERQCRVIDNAYWLAKKF